MFLIRRVHVICGSKYTLLSHSCHKRNLDSLLVFLKCVLGCTATSLSHLTVINALCLNIVSSIVLFYLCPRGKYWFSVRLSNISSVRPSVITSFPIIISTNVGHNKLKFVGGCIIWINRLSLNMVPFRSNKFWQSCAFWTLKKIKNSQFWRDEYIKVMECFLRWNCL